MYVYEEFPKWKYHPEKEPLIVEDKKSEKALGKGWFNSPAEFPKTKSEESEGVIQ